ncbi:MAG: hypothetical protein LBV18_05995 [Alistipes sp.]|jgi:hypothetical protein|nr:hypothetical protein [Alistipes sp.]
MKHYIKIAAALLLGAMAFGSAGCDKGGETREPETRSTITATPGALGFIYKGGTVSVTVTSDAEWEIVGHEPWIETSVEGDKLWITVKPAVSDRSGKVTLENAVGDAAEVAISQTAMPDGELIVATKALELSGEGESRTVEVYSAQAWTAETGDEWIELSNKTSGSFRVSARSTRVERSGTITVTCGELTQTIAVTQAASTKGVQFTRLGAAQYFGDYYEIGVDNFLLAFETADYELGGGADGLTPVSGYGITLDILSLMPDDPDDAELAEGTYVADKSIPVPFSLIINSDWTYVVLTEPEAVKMKIESGTMDLSMDDDGTYHIVFEFVLADGSPFRGKYDGPITFVNES